jgi:hypothetical protein
MAKRSGENKTFKNFARPFDGVHVGLYIGITKINRSIAMNNTRRQISTSPGAFGRGGWILHQPVRGGRAWRFRRQLNTITIGDGLLKVTVR